MAKRDPEAEIKRLEAELEECRRVRNAWCAEYVKLRDKLAGASVAALSAETPRR